MRATVGMARARSVAARLVNARFRAMNNGLSRSALWLHAMANADWLALAEASLCDERRPAFVLTVGARLHP